MSAASSAEAGADRRHTRRLFERWHDHGDRFARERLVAEFMPLAVSLVRRYQRTSEPIEDLVQVAALGLVKAIDGFDPERGTSFASYAIPTILGELRRYFRDSGWALHVPRRDKELAHSVGEARRRITGETGRAPTAQRLAEFMELDIEEVLRGLRALNAYTTVAFESSGEEAEAAPGIADTHGSCDPGFGRVEQRATLADALRRLSDEELELLRMRFEDELTQAEIAGRIGVSQMHVSRLLRRCYGRLRAQIEAPPDVRRCARRDEFAGRRRS